MKLSTIFVSAAGMFLISSCSLLSSIKGTSISGASATTDHKQQTTATTETPKTPAKQTSANAAAASTDNQKKGAASVSSAAQATTNKQKVDPNLADKLAGEWMIISVGGKNLQTVDDMPYINFEKATGHFYASNGCNILNGVYTLSSGKLTFDNVLSTMKMCPDVQFESEISAVFSGASPVTVKIDKIGHESYLKLLNTSGKELMTARKHNMDFLNGNWLITSVNGKAIDDEEANIFIDINELKIHGNTGCNFFNGQVYINPDKSNAIDFSNMALTRMACPKMEQESAIMLALEETASAIQGNPGQVMLLSQSGKELMTLKKAPLPAEE